MSAPRFEPGEIVTARLMGPRTSAQSDHPNRPAVLVDARANDGWWAVMGLTSLDRYADDSPRTPYPPQACLSGGYLWGDTLHFVPPSSVRTHIGWVDDAMVDTIAAATGRSSWDLEPMRPHARSDRHRGLQCPPS